MLASGDKVQVTYMVRNKPRSYTAVVVGDYDAHVSVSRGNYVESICTVDIISGKVKIDVIDREGNLVARAKKIDKETLIKEILEHGWSTKTAKLIGEKYGVSKLTVQTYYGKWGLADLIGEMKAAEEFPKKPVVVSLQKEDGRTIVMEEKSELNEVDQVKEYNPNPRKEEPSCLKKLCLNEVLLEGNVLDYKVVIGAEERYIELRNKENDGSQYPLLYIDTLELTEVIAELQELHEYIERVE
ncbi:hypothetical protein [Anaerosolibacter sp.]|uniref:hypothetical protein n=1 Tax=Anaerosolibacter sp. TaxID=1872527 RepID=UPI0039EDFB94